MLLLWIAFKLEQLVPVVVKTSPFTDAEPDKSNIHKSLYTQYYNLSPAHKIHFYFLSVLLMIALSTVLWVLCIFTLPALCTFIPPCLLWYFCTIQTLWNRKSKGQRYEDKALSIKSVNSFKITKNLSHRN